MTNPTASASIALTRNPSFPFERVFWALALFLLLSVPVLLWLLLPIHDAASLEKIGDRLFHDPRLYLAPAGLVASVIWHWRTRYCEQLLINDRGIHYTPPFHWWPQRAYSLAWSDIERIQLRPFSQHQPNATPILQLTARGRQFKIWPLSWFPERISWAEHLQRRRIRRTGDLARVFADSALAQQLASRGQIVEVPTAKARGFDLFGNPMSRTVVIALFVLLAYALVDAMLAQQRFLDFNPWPLLLLCALIAFASVTVLLRRFAVPLLESVGLAALCGVACGAAGYSALLRLNQFSDWDGSETVQYIKQADGTFSADGFPNIQVEAFEPYWDQYPAGQHYPFTLFRGSLGFWQLDEAPVNAQMRAFYRERDQY